MSSPVPPLRIAVVGGGMVGVALTAALVKAQHKGANLSVDLYESAARFTEIGAGVLLGPNAIRTLDRMELGEAIHWDKENKYTVWAEYRAGEKSHASPDVALAQTTSHEPSCGVYRADFIDRVASLIPPSVTHFSHRCTGFLPPSCSAVASDGGILEFSNGSRVEVDVVFACDGIKSTLRRDMYRRQGRPERAQEPQYSGIVIYRGMAGKEATESLLGRVGCSTAWFGKDRHSVLYPVRGGELYNWACVVRDKDHSKVGEHTGPWAETVPTDALLDDMAGFIEPALCAIKQSKQASMWGMFTTPQLDTYIGERLAVLGDAAHAMLPTLAAGVGQGFEDAFFIYSLFTSDALTRSGRAERRTAIAEALQLYDAYRRPHANDIVASSTRTADLMHFRTDHGEDVEQIAQILEQSLRGIWEYDLPGEAERAVTKLGGSTGGA